MFNFLKNQFNMGAKEGSSVEGANVHDEIKLDQNPTVLNSENPNEKKEEFLEISVVGKDGQGEPAYFVFAKEINGTLSDEATQQAKNDFIHFGNLHPEVVSSWQGMPIADCIEKARNLEPGMF